MDEITDEQIRKAERRDELRNLCLEFFATTKFQARLARLMKVSEPAVSVWMNGGEISESVLIAMRALCDVQRLRDSKRRIESVIESLSRIKTAL